MSAVLAAVAIAAVTGIMFLAIRYRVHDEVLFFAGLGMFFSAFSSNPQHPESASGHVYQLNNHGSYVYVTKADYIRIFGTMVGGWSVSAASITVGYLIAQRRGPMKPEQP
jgi:hypothetical protein